MNFLTTVHILASVVILPLAWAKLIEICLHMRPSYRPLADDELRRRDPAVGWPITAIMSRIFARLPSFLRPFLFRYKVLMSGLIFLAFAATKSTISVLVGVTLYMAMGIEIVRIISDQIKYGSAIYLKDVLRANPLFIPKTGPPQAQPLLAAFLKLFLGLCGIVILGFAGIFNIVYVWSNNAFNGIPDDGWRIVHLTYFSIASLSTVGFGDISPGQSLISRFLVGSEIVFGFLIVVALLSSISLTFSASVKDKNE